MMATTDPLSDDLIEVVNRDDDRGVYNVRIGVLSPIVTIVLTQDGGFWMSHGIKTPEQATPYRTSRPLGDNALYGAVTALTHFYSLAVREGHKPEDAWLTPTLS